MNILVLGGTQFIGRHIVETLLAAGHGVSVLNRGKSPDELPPRVERIRADRDQGPAGLAGLAGRSWDACIDVSGYTAVHVRASATALRERVGRYVYISAVAVYGDPELRPVRENHPRVAPAAEDVTELDQESYGRLKVTCENLVEEFFPGRCALLRPQVVAGPLDPSGRYTYWVKRATRGGEMLAPGDGWDHVQVVDVRDVARFARAVVEGGLGGAYNLSGPRITWAEFVDILGAERVAWVGARVLEAANLSFLELPLYRPERGPRSGLMDVSNERACAAGLVLTEPAVTARDTGDWMRDREMPATALSPAREADLIAASRRTSARP
ncbi:MAG: NAD-dependent epimerase/dehydratase family protein [Candidatus Eisenbacteria bacterium]|nr:NAD-dependent epimerase/dehydratase family protein [Candidatus Eisenbacteria bacterium]